MTKIRSINNQRLNKPDDLFHNIEDLSFDEFRQALELQPGDKNALCSRSRCRLQMGDTRGALEDAEEALNNDSTYVKGQFVISVSSLA